MITILVTECSIVRFVKSLWHHISDDQFYCLRPRSDEPKFRIKTIHD